ncbi:UNVERIFIED_CONTAM: hypothetical protein Sindi_2809700 [Sesamum indicum]
MPNSSKNPPSDITKQGSNRRAIWMTTGTRSTQSIRCYSAAKVISRTRRMRRRKGTTVSESSKHMTTGEEEEAEDTPAGDGDGGEVGDCREVGLGGVFYGEQQLLGSEIEKMPSSNPPAAAVLLGGRRVGGTEATNLNEKRGDLTTKSGVFRAPPLLLLGDSSSSINGGRRAREFNMTQFLSLAYRVVDDGDDVSMEALEALKSRWEERYGNGGNQTTQTETETRGVATTFGTPPATTERANGANAETGSPALGKTDETLGQLCEGFFGNKSDEIVDETREKQAADISFFWEKKQPSPDAARKIGDHVQTGLYVGNIPLYASPEQASSEDKIAQVFNNSSRKTLAYVAPTVQNGEVIVRPSLEIIREGSKRWKSTAVGYFLGKKPYFHHLKEFATSIWPALRDVTATANGFFFFQFKSVIDMEEVIEGGPWFFQGQPIVLQKWEPGMAMRKLKHTQVPVWIKLRHLPVELWTTEGLSTVASGVGKPLYPDAITRACTRLDFARVCVMLDITSTLPKHIIIMTPNEGRGETPCKVDVEYEWVPPKCKSCMSLGHSIKDCSLIKPAKPTKPPVTIYVPKAAGPRVPRREENVTKESNVLQPETPRTSSFMQFEESEPPTLDTHAPPARRGEKKREDKGISSLGGDFNAVRDLSEVCGASGDIRLAMEEFNNCIQNAGLLPLPMQGEWYTWHNCSAGPRNLWKRLDRILINDTWNARFAASSYSSLTPRTSDHSPMVLYGDRQQQLGGMFRFDNYLTRSPKFISSVQSIWQHEIVGVPMYAVTRKLKALKPVFREQRRNKGDLSHNVQLAKGFLEAAQILVSSNRQEDLFLLLEHCCRMVLAKAAKLEEIMLRQRAKMEWMKGGDQCSRVFFRKIAQRRTARRILQINDEHGVTHREQEAVINEFVSFYHNLLGGERRRDMVDIRFLRPWARHLLTDEEVNSILLPFTPSDVKQALFDIAEDKAPGPDGYSSGFFKAAWPIIGREVTRAVLDFFTTGRLLKQINTTLLALIPKVHSPMAVSDFRPISCCNVLYKIIAKLIVQRLSVVLDKLISPCQAAFVPGRSIGDNIMLAQELFSGYNQTRLPPRCALKVDIRKAYDTVEWDFLSAVLQLFGFPNIFIRWIEECVTTASFSVGLNGKPHGFFTGARGLRQGDPLSPYLFVLVMEVLHLGFLQLIDQDELFTFHWKCEAARVFQLGFADDILLFSRANIASIGVFKTGLDRFAGWSGLKLNVQKSHLIISRSAQGMREDMLTLLGFQEGQLPMRYLGLPLISSRLSASNCQPLLIKIDQRIAGWEGLQLSYAGRVQIIKSVLTSLSVYWASAFILPKKIIKEIEKRVRAFLWKGTGNSGYAKVAWKDVCRPVVEGGQGISDVATLNRALMSKKLCDVIRCERTSIWVDWLYAGRLQKTSVWIIRDDRGSWGWRKLLRLRSFLRPMVDYRIGDGTSFYIWQDPWHPLGPLIDRFPRAPDLLGLHLSTKLSSVICGGNWRWPPITDFECLDITHLLPPIHGGADRIIWRLDGGQPSTKALTRLFDPPGTKVDWASLLSGSCKIPRHLLILWMAILGKLPTTDKPWLSHLGDCVLCDGTMETHTHLFFQCRYSRRCLSEIRRLVRFPWPNRDWANDIDWAARKWRGKHIVNLAYRALLASCVYHIWRERNLRRFEHEERTSTTLAFLIVNDVKQKILSINLACSVSTCALYRLWRIPWSVTGETN